MNRTYTSRSIATTILILSLGVLTIGVLYRQTFTQRHAIGSNRMSPALEHGSSAIVNTRSLAERDPKRGEIVLAKGHILRVVGLPDEFVTVADGFVFVDDWTLNEPYMSGISEAVAVQLGQDEFLLLPDNRAGSVPLVVSREEIVGLAVWHTGGVLPLSAVSHYPHPQ